MNGPQWNTLSILRGVSEGSMIRYAIKKKEPLRAEQESFIARVQGSESSVVDGCDGEAALALALAMIESSQIHQALSFPVPLDAQWHEAIHENESAVAG